MGLFDFIKGKKSGGGEKTPASKWADKAGDKRAQNIDRQEALHALAEMGTADAVAALLKRFNFVMDPSITDQEEKDIAFNGILRAGKDAVEPVRAFAAKAGSLAWPMKILERLLDEQEYIEELLVWLKKWDTEYSKFVDPKVQILTKLEEFKHPKIREAVERFLEDVNEPSRFHAVATLLAQDDAASVDALARVVADEESVRVRNKIADGVAARGWVVPDEHREGMRKALGYAYQITADGKITKRDQRD
jgi:hypothetical protein